MEWNKFVVKERERKTRKTQWEAFSFRHNVGYNGHTKYMIMDRNDW